MLYLALFLHFYQPPTQFPQITKKIAKESYEKLLKIIYYRDRSCLTVNISASLTEQLVALGLGRIIDGFKALAKEGRVELTGSAAYHPLLPKIPKREMVRQIKLNEETNREYFGPSGKGFFPPEMAYSPEVGEVVERLGYKWIILDESALPGDYTSVNFIYRKKNSKLAVFIRNRKLSLKIAFSGITNIGELLKFFDRERYDLNGDGYIIVALDGETFGHHQPGQLKFLEEILEAPSSKFQVPIKFVTISELLNLFPKRLEIEPQTSSWGESWKRWDDPKNPIHRLQWRLYRLALNQKNLTSSRLLLDRALHSDQFWWASHSPCWHPKMIERGARILKDVVLLGESSQKEKEEAKKLYDDIILTGRKLYGERIVPC